MSEKLSNSADSTPLASAALKPNVHDFGDNVMELNCEKVLGEGTAFERGCSFFQPLLVINASDRPICAQAQVKELKMCQGRGIRKQYRSLGHMS